MRHGHETIWILGGGQFGRRAAEQMRRKKTDASITIVEKQAITGFSDDIHGISAGAIEWFVENFQPGCPATMIIPALPLHLAADWLKEKLTEDGRVVRSQNIPDALLNTFPNPIRINSSRCAVSHANFLCPPNCPEPDELCTYTQKKRPQPLYQLLQTIHTGSFLPLIVRSRQFAPGVGGFIPEDLWALLEKFTERPGTLQLIGTACKCHGIVDGLYLEKV